MSNTNETRIVLGSLRYKSAPNVDYGVKVPFEQSNQNYIEYDRNLNVDLAQVFDNERQFSTTFRPAAKITFLTKNSYTGETSYTPFKDNLYLVNQTYYRDLQLNVPPGGTTTWGGFPPYNEFDLIRNDYDVTGYTQPPNNHIQFVSKSASTYNWNYFISYAFSADTTKQLQWNYSTNNSLKWTCSDGIPFILERITINGNNLFSLKCPVKHGLSTGEYVNFNNLSYKGSSIFEVYSLGNGTYGTEENYVNIFDYGFTGTTFTPGITGTFKRVININNPSETTSQYYVRRHKILTNVSDSVLVNSGFELNIFDYKSQFQSVPLTPNYQENIVVKNGNQSYTLSFSKDVNLNGLVDNQKKPVSELYYTIIHKGYFGWFYPSQQYRIKQGYEYNLERQIIGGVPKPNNYWLPQPGLPPYLNQSYDLSLNSYVSNNLNFYYVNSLKSGDTIDGSFCEWNDFTQEERKISDLYYKVIFNPQRFNIGTTPLNPEGYYYSPHYPVTIRAYSDYIEEGENKSEFDIPDYAYYSKFRGAFRWRDIYTYGFIDNNNNGVDFPFLNGVHHPYKNIIFRLIPEGSNSLEIPFGTIEPIIDDCE